ncbi:probable methylcrotonoyl-CoA carboxylase biotin carboxylase chain [Melanopsichium pennsylvanicum]|uniref:Related to DUR1,2-Urea amidolyase n=2 Tax=Melanopsichium pennsylvanicum TaxID=63383 RepID=A0A077QUM6_9BASI|nr:related to DUR1,2-Urea amidolyase [Melanopsichium pennsylvanicum 4]SNX83833.1 probable methylcrotonoyl-CoA carboxylase biotin carboxylase chain [Melanopsichium pennsylvanicum]
MASIIAQGFTASEPRFQPQALRKVLIANRGEIALRLIRTCKALRLPTVSVYSSDDAAAPHVSAADEAFLLEGKESDGKGYLDQQAVIDICKHTGANCILPGYGFLSENPSFARLVESTPNLIFAGPRSETMNSFGLKHQARIMAEKAGVPCVPGTHLLNHVQEALEAAENITYPVILKSTAGGGGLGLQVCRSSDELKGAFDKITSRGKALFGDPSVFLEKYVEKGRHVEVQIFGNGQGQAVNFGERECSIQRRHQKVIEECPSPFVHKTPGLREKLTSCAVALAESANYRSAGTVEMLVDDDTASFYFLEVNARLQVEHCVTELCYDVDLVALMLMQADAELNGKRGISAETLKRLQKDGPKGAAIEARLYAENPIRDFAPTPGLLQNVEYATDKIGHARIDGWVSSGTKISASYDPMLSKMCVWAPTREAAINDACTLYNHSKVQGTPTNLGLLRAIVASKLFAEGKTLTSFLTSQSGFEYRPCAFEVISGGISTTVQDHKGRKGVGHGVPEAGAMDPLSLQLANLIAGNPAGTEALEMTLTGPELLFHAHAVVALAGANMDMTLDGEPVECYTRLIINKGSKLKITKVAQGAAGCRSYLAIRGGLPEVSVYLGSKSTCPSLALGGYQGRALLAGDTLEMDVASSELAASGKVQEYSLPKSARLSALFDESNGPKGWPLLCMTGPFDDQGFLTTQDRQKLYGSSWKVSHQASRTGIRLEGPRFEWARKDGSEGGSHPSNVLEYGYSSRGINMNGDVPVILGRDGPDLGGLLISNTIISSEWRDGQMKPSDKLHFVAITFDQAREVGKRVEQYLEQIKNAADGNAGDIKALCMNVSSPIYASGDYSKSESILASIDEAVGERPQVKIRCAGDRFVMMEYGDMTADIINRCRIELLIREINKTKSNHAIVDLNPNLRSVTIQIDPTKVYDLQELVNWLTDLETKIPSAKDVKIPTREFTLPVTFHDPQVALSIQKYMETVRSKAVYLPDNTEYLAEANGYASTEQVEEAVVGCRQLAVGVGFFMGTPILLPLDPRKRMRCQKYNPTRLTTPAGALGHGGSCFAIYPVSCPGGYALLGRTLPCWSTFGDKPGFTHKRPYLFENFDTIQFEKVDQSTYDQALREFDAGIYQWKVKDTIFDVTQQSSFLDSIQQATDEFRKQQAISLAKAEQKEEKLFAEWQAEVQAAEKRKADGQSFSSRTDQADDVKLEDFANDAKAIPITSSVAANVWKVLVSKGEKVEPGQKVAILEAMKMEIDIVVPQGCTLIKAVLKPPGSSVDPGEAILVGGQQ